MLASLHSKRREQILPEDSHQLRVRPKSSGHACGHGGLCVPTGYELEISTTLAILVGIRGHDSPRLSSKPDLTASHNDSKIRGATALSGACFPK